MDKYTYCLVNSWISSHNPGRHVYVQFPYILDTEKKKLLIEELQNARSDLASSPEATPFDVVQNTLLEMNRKYNILGSIVDKSCELIIF